MRAGAPTVYLVDDHQVFRQSTVSILQAAGLHVRDFQDAGSLLTHLSGYSVLPMSACVISDARMSKMSGLELVEELKRREYAIPVIFLIGYADVPLAVEAMRRGAVDVIQEPFVGEVLLEAIRFASGASSGPGGTRQAYSAGCSNAELANLTRRERQVAELIMAGKSNKTIAGVLGISRRTVEVHRAHLMKKLRVRTVTDLVKACLGYL